jgi:hypothetical protein
LQAEHSTKTGQSHLARVQGQSVVEWKNTSSSLLP